MLHSLRSYWFPEDLNLIPPSPVRIYLLMFGLLSNLRIEAAETFQNLITLQDCSL
jgi:hypothetical protein